LHYHSLFKLKNNKIMTTTNTANAVGVVSKETLLKNWVGHRGLTRRVIAAFPEKDFFSFSIGGMRPFAAMCQELLAIARPGIEEIASGNQATLDEEVNYGNTKEAYLKKWDEDTEAVINLWNTLPEERFSEKIKAFGKFEGTVLSSIQYFIDNEIHHRAQGYVYLRALGVEPPAFWDR
jgi:uncharacterized damage-inducible protein DinB